MNRKFVSFGILMVLAGGLAAAVCARDPATAALGSAIDDAMRKKIDQKAAKIVGSLKLTDTSSRDTRRATSSSPSPID